MLLAWTVPDLSVGQILACDCTALLELNFKGPYCCHSQSSSQCLSSGSVHACHSVNLSWSPRADQLSGFGDHTFSFWRASWEVVCGLDHQELCLPCTKELWLPSVLPHPTSLPSCLVTTSPGLIPCSVWWGLPPEVWAQCVSGLGAVDMFLQCSDHRDSGPTAWEGPRELDCPAKSGSGKNNSGPNPGPLGYLVADDLDIKLEFIWVMRMVQVLTFWKQVIFCKQTVGGPCQLEVGACSLNPSPLLNQAACWVPGTWGSVEIRPCSWTWCGSESYDVLWAGH